MKINKHMPVKPQMKSAEAMDARMRDAAKMYEKLFLREMVKAMRKTVPESSLTKPSMAEGIFKEKLDGEYVDSWGEKGGIGLSKIIYNQLKEKFGNRQQFGKPAGPMPINKGTTFKIDETQDVAPKVKPINAEGEVTEKVSYLIKSDIPEGKNRVEVTAPWEGEVSNIQNLADNYKMIEINHDHGLKSKMVFKGNLENELTDKTVSPGQKLGDLMLETSQLNWSIEQKSKV